MSFWKRLFGGSHMKQAVTSRPSPPTPTNSTNVVASSKASPDARSHLKRTLESARARKELPDLNTMLNILVSVEQLANYATLVHIALETAAECRGVYIGELKNSYMKFWWQWHNHQNDPRYRAEKVIVLAGEAAQVYPDSEIEWPLLSYLQVWVDKNCPDRSEMLKKHFGAIPTLDEIQKYQRTA